MVLVKWFRNWSPQENFGDEGHMMAYQEIKMHKIVDPKLLELKNHRSQV